jgi:hypothetical protein
MLANLIIVGPRLSSLSGKSLFRVYIAKVCRKRDAIMRGYAKIKTGMSSREVESIIGEPDEINPNKIGYSYVYLISRAKAHGSADDKNEHLVRVLFNHQDIVIQADHW